MRDQSGKRGEPSNRPAGGDAFRSMLDAMSAAELREALSHALEAEDYDPALIDAYLDALDRRDPMPEMPDAKTSYAALERKLYRLTGRKPAAPRRRRGAGRAVLAAALAAVCLLGLMVAAQASGVNIFGTMAQWTDEVFSLGSVRSGGTVGTGYVVPKEPAEYSTLQEALDAYQVTEVSAPAWIPEGYVLELVMAKYWEDSQWLTFYCQYMNGDDLLSIEIDSYQNEPNVQIEKTDAPVEVMETDGVTVYLLENANNNAAAWATEHFEYTIFGPIEKAELSQMALSAIAAEK